MSVFTRDKMEKMYLQNLEEEKEKNIQQYVNSIKDTIFRLNQKGTTKYVHVHYGQRREQDIVSEIARRLYEIFIDSEIVVHKADPDSSDPDSISINWSNN